jgi:hypothetical protein
VACAERAAAKAVNNAELCPISQTPIHVSTEASVADRCIVCLDALSDTVMLPCSHQAAWFVCSTRMWLERHQ